ncbi:tryptophan-rich sensory protein [Pseudanabaena sp. FACHB-2040]|uniref:tryptophan-rich sensory protein n=1 Tax=Pseudanabaena sp. FACHB-2040 TaxID=2692859 RepID=UPI0016868069|nr:tryptophan-rich sensory protein [Pseudanabaena sp. FACHB-2040]MBD2261002.1 tryptophan-rich sensory protein [Pseudanabaena sp. FACHB-2040]
MTESTHHSGSGKALAIATIAIIFITIFASSILNNFPPPGGRSVALLANNELRGVLVIPANYAFAIWGLIYLGVIAYGFYQYKPVQQGDSRLQKVDWLLIVACLSQIAWSLLFPLRLYWFSVLAMLGILVSLAGIYVTLGTGLTPARRKERWSAHIPFSTYLAWISVATIVNIASALYANGWNGFGLSAPIWTVIMLIVGAVIAAILAVQRGDIAFTLVFVWAYIAVAIRQSEFTAVWITAVSAAIALLALLFLGRRNRQSARVESRERSTTNVS